MSTLRVLGCLAAALAVGLASGCKQGPARPKVAFVTNNPAGGFWSIAEAGCKKGAADFDVEVLFRKPPQGEAGEQKQVIDTLLGQSIKAISVSVIDPKNQTDYLDEIAARVPLLTQDNDAPRSKRKAYIGTNNYQAGRAVGKLVKEALPDGGTIVIFVGQLESLNARQRRQGVIDEVAGRPPLTDLVDFTPSPDGEDFGKYRTWSRTYLDQPEGESKAKPNAVDALTALQKEIDKGKGVCMVGLWAYNPPAILAAVKDKGALGKVQIVGFDEDYTTLDGIRDGDIYATVVQQPFEFGYRSVKLMAALARDPNAPLPPGGAEYVPYRIVMKDAAPAKDGEPKRESAVAFREELDRLLGKQ